MTVYQTAFLLQAAAILCVTTIGYLSHWGTARGLFISAILISPVPLFVATPGVAGFVFVGDILAAIGAVVLTLPRTRRQPRSKGQRELILGAAILLLVLPALSAGIQLTFGYRSDTRLLTLGLARSGLYLVMFLTCVRIGQSKRFPLAASLRTQALVFSTLCAFGFYQFIGGMNVDLWNYVTESDVGKWSGGFGAGFMGLYRGAVGAWGALILSIVPGAFLIRHSHSRLYLPFVVTSIFLGILIVGSRQGLLFGALALCIGMARTGAGYFHHLSRRSILKNGLYALVIVTLTVFAAKASLRLIADTAFSTWVSTRFEVFQTGSSVLEDVKARDTRVWDVAYQISRQPAAYIFGVGEGSIVPTAPSRPFSLVYVDSEIAWTVQRIGFVGLIFYLAWLLRFFWFLRQKRNTNDESSHAYHFGGNVLLIGCALLYGDFFLLHVQSSNAPMAYWLWSMLGLGLGSSSKRNLSQFPARGHFRYQLSSAAGAQNHSTAGTLIH